MLVALTGSETFTVAHQITSSAFSSHCHHSPKFSMCREAFLSLLVVMLTADFLTTWAAPLTKRSLQQQQQQQQQQISITGELHQPQELSIDNVFPSRRRRSVPEQVAPLVEGASEKEQEVAALAPEVRRARHRRSTAALFLSGIIHICDNNAALCSRVREVEVSDLDGARAVIRLEQE